MENPVVIFGAGMLGRLALDNFGSNNVLIYGFLDSNNKLHNTEVSEVLVLGDLEDEELLKIIGNKTEAFVAIENKTHKEKIVKMLMDKCKVMPVNAIHSRSIVSDDAEIGHGILVAAGAVINSGAIVGNHSVINSNAVIDPLAEIGEYVEIGSGSMINSGVKIEKGAFVGSGSIIVSGVKIGKNARIGAGSVVIADVVEGQTVFGNPAKQFEK